VAVILIAAKEARAPEPHSSSRLTALSGKLYTHFMDNRQTYA